MDRYWVKVMELAKEHGFIAQAYGGVALLVTHAVQKERWGEEEYQRIQEMNGRVAEAKEVKDEVEVKEEPKIIHERAKETAKKIRKELKKNFPGQKFSVRSARYSGGDSVAIRWTDGPREKDVREITNQFESYSFDGMTDSGSYSYYEYAGKRYCGAKFISCQREMTEEYRARLEEIARKNFRDFKPGGHRYHYFLKEAEEILNS